ncbi:MAG: hypothetical protein DYG89_48380 [Caldilinea sp. CFX5]|nr:hypothetical protein [Caldilinea sp. CFX5]
MSTANPSTDPMRLEQPLVIDERIKQMIAGAVAEIDLAQTALSRTMTPAQRVWQALSMMRTAERVSAVRLRQKQPELSEDEAVLAVRQRGLVFRAKVEERWRTNRLG